MEIQFHQNQKQKMGNFKGKNKFIGVRQRPSGRYVAEIKDTTQKIRMWLGTFETAEAAARAYDEAACLLRGSKTRTNFVTQVSANSPLAYRIKNLLNSKSKTEAKQSKNKCIDIASGNSSTSSCSSSPIGSEADFSCSLEVNDHTHLFDHAYKPDLSICYDAFDLVKETEEIQSLDIASSTSSCSSSPIDSEGDFSCSLKVNDQTQFLDHAYKPDLSICGDDFDMGFSCRSNMFLGLGVAQDVLELPSSEMEFSDFERMKVERQISASLYAMNGVQEYMENVYDPSEAIWDLPTLCSLLC